MTNDFDLAAARKNLIAQRLKFSGNNAVTVRLSTLIEQLEILERGTGDRVALEKLIEANLIDLAELTRASSVPKGDGT